MSHPGVEEVAEHLEGLLTSEADERVRAHLRDCADCAAVAHELGAVPDTLRAAAAPTSAIPGPVVERVEAAIAAESRSRSESAGVTSLTDRRQRRRRAVGGALVAAAAVMVVAVGVTEVLDESQRSQTAAGESGRASAGPLQKPLEGTAEDAAPSTRGPSGPPAAFGSRRQDVSGDGASARLVDRVAAGHRPGEPQRERAGCVAAALGDAGWSGASYAVVLGDGRGGGGPGAVVLRPAGSPGVGILVACAPEPRVLLRRQLGE